jgi:hypothetical protein
LAADFREQATRAFALLERGLGDQFPAQPAGGTTRRQGSP